LLTACSELARSEGAPTPAAVEALRAAAADADLAYLVTELPAAIEQTMTGIGQIKKIVKAMKEFSHPADDTKAIDLNHAVETTVTVAKNEWKYVADVKLDLAPNLPTISCNPSEINQVLLNLIVNAAHAIGEVVGNGGKVKGEIRITTRADAEHVFITVADTGCGIPEVLRHKIFDPFFTTKAIGKGTGQGLAITHRVVQRHGGSIDLDSVVGKGTRFTIRLPLTRGPATKPEPQQQKSA
jgi:signal transduction histidine kinase